MANISEILSLARFDNSSDKNKGNAKYYKHYGAVAKQPNTQSIATDDKVASEEVFPTHERREGTDRRSSDSQRNKRFELRSKNDRRKAKSISITA